MAKRKSVKKRVVKKENPVQVVLTHPPMKSGLNKDKSDGIMAIMAGVLVLLTAILDTKISAILAVVLMVLFAGYKLIKR